MSLAHYDSLTLSRDQLRQAEALFYAIERLLDDPASIAQAKRLADLGGETCREAADDLQEQAAQALEGREGWS